MPKIIQPHLFPPHAPITEDEVLSFAELGAGATSPPALYTTTYSSHSAKSFMELLHAANVTALWDVRWTTSSQFKPEFSKKRLSAHLEAAGIAYVHRRVLGVRRDYRETLRSLAYAEAGARYRALVTEEGVDLERLKGELRRVTALLCACPKGKHCHRLHLADALGGGREL